MGVFESKLDLSPLLRAPKDVIHRVFNYLPLYTLKGIALAGNWRLFHATRIVMQRRFVWNISDTVDVRELDVFIESMKSSGLYTLNITLYSYRHIPRLKKHNVWDRIRYFECYGNGPGLALPPFVQELRLLFYNRPGLVIPESVQRICLYEYNHQDLKIPDTVLRVHLHNYDQPGLIVPRNARRVRLDNYNQPGLILPDGVEHVDLRNYDCKEVHFPGSIRFLALGSYNCPGLVLPAGLERVYLYRYNHPGLVLPLGLKSVYLAYYNQPGLMLPDSVQTVQLDNRGLQTLNFDQELQQLKQQMRRQLYHDLSKFRGAPRILQVIVFVCYLPTMIAMGYLFL